MKRREELDKYREMGEDELRAESPLLLEIPLVAAARDDHEPVDGRWRWSYLVDEVQRVGRRSVEPEVVDVFERPRGGRAR